MTLSQIKRWVSVNFVVCNCLVITALIIALLTDRRIDPIALDEDMSHWTLDYLGGIIVTTIFLG